MKRADMVKRYVSKGFWLLYGFLGVIFLAIIGLVLAIELVDWNAYRRPIAEALSKEIGVDIGLNGPIGVRLFPAPSLTVRDISLGNAPDNDDKLTANLIALALDFGAFFAGEIAIESLEIEGMHLGVKETDTGWALIGWPKALDEPKISKAPAQPNPETNPESNPEANPDEAPYAGAASTKQAQDKSGKSTSPRLRLEAVRLRESHLQILPQKGSGYALDIARVDLSGQLPAGPLAASVFMGAGGEALRFDLALQPITAGYSIKLASQIAGSDWSFTGAWQDGGLRGRLKAEGPDFMRLLTLMQTMHAQALSDADRLSAGSVLRVGQQDPIRKETIAPQAFALDGNIEETAGLYRFVGPNIKIGESHGRFDIRLKSGDLVYLNAMIALERLDLDSLQQLAGAMGPPAQGPEEAEKTPDFTLGFGGDIEISVQTVQLGHALANQIDANIHVSPHQFELEHMQGLLPGGTRFFVRGLANLKPQKPALSANNINAALPYFDGRIQIETGQLRALLAAFDTGLPDRIAPDRLSILSLNGDFRLSAQDWSLKLHHSHLGTIAFAGQMTGAYKNALPKTLALQIANINFDSLLQKTLKSEAENSEAQQKTAISAPNNTSLAAGFEAKSRAGSTAATAGLAEKLAEWLAPFTEETTLAISLDTGRWMGEAVRDVNLQARLEQSGLHIKNFSAEIGSSFLEGAVDIAAPISVDKAPEARNSFKNITPDWQSEGQFRWQNYGQEFARRAPFNIPASPSATAQKNKKPAASGEGQSAFAGIDLNELRRAAGFSQVDFMLTASGNLAEQHMTASLTPSATGLNKARTEKASVESAENIASSRAKRQINLDGSLDIEALWQGSLKGGRWRLNFSHDDLTPLLALYEYQSPAALEARLNGEFLFDGAQDMAGQLMVSGLLAGGQIGFDLGFAEDFDPQALKLHYHQPYAEKLSFLWPKLPDLTTSLSFDMMATKFKNRDGERWQLKDILFQNGLFRADGGLDLNFQTGDEKTGIEGYIALKSYHSANHARAPRLKGAADKAKNNKSQPAPPKAAENFSLSPDMQAFLQHLQGRLKLSLSDIDMMCMTLEAPKALLDFKAADGMFFDIGEGAKLANGKLLAQFTYGQTKAQPVIGSSLSAQNGQADGPKNTQVDNLKNTRADSPKNTQADNLKNTHDTSRTAAPYAALSLQADALDLGGLLDFLDMPKPLAGQASVKFDARWGDILANNPLPPHDFDFLRDLKGQFFFTVKGGALYFMDAPRLIDLAAKAETGPAFLNKMVETLKGGQSDLSSLEGRLKFDEGIALLEQFNAQGLWGQLNLDGQIDLVGERLNLAGNLALASPKDTPPIPLRYQGSIFDPKADFSARLFERFVLAGIEKRLRSRVQEQIGTIASETGKDGSPGGVLGKAFEILGALKKKQAQEDLKTPKPDTIDQKP